MRAWFGRGKHGRTLFFDEEATNLIRAAARRQHRSFKYVVIQGLKRGVKKANMYRAKDWKNT